MIAFTVLLIASMASSAQERVAIPQSARTGSAHMRGVIIDETSGEPVPWTTILLFQRDLTEVLVTDAHGYFVSEGKFGKRGVWVHAWDNAGTRSRLNVPHAIIEFDPAASNDTIHECRLDVGRRLELDLTLPVGWTLRDLKALVLHMKHDGSTGTQSVIIHEDAPPWIRLGSWRGPSRNADRLRIVTRDGLHAAMIDLDRSGNPDRPRVRLMPCGILSIRAFGDGPGHRRPLTLELVPAGREPGDAPDAISMNTALGVQARIQWIPPGEWTLTVSSDFFNTRRQTLFIPPSGVTRTTIRLGKELMVGALRIIVAEEAGDVPAWDRGMADAPSLSAVVTTPASGRVMTILSSAFCGNGVDAWFRRQHRGGRYVYEAILEDVPAHDYVVTVRSKRLLDRRVAKMRPGETATFVFLEETPEGAYGLRVSSASPGEKPPRYSLLPIQEDPTFPLSPTPNDAGLHASGLPAEGDIEWVVQSRGFQRAYGTRASFRPARSPERSLWAEVVLEPGYGIRAHARNRSGEPLRGVIVEFCGGRFRTNSAGLAYLSSSNTEPEYRLDVRDWEIVGGNVRRDGTFDGGFRGWLGITELRMTLE